MTDLDETPSPDFGQTTRQDVFTPEGTPGPPHAASTVARPPPRPRRLPNVNLLNDDLEGMIKNLSLDNASVSFTKHQDTPYSSPNIPDRSSLGILSANAMKTDFSHLAPNHLDQSYTPPSNTGKNFVRCPKISKTLIIRILFDFSPLKADKS